ncbi:MAG TPA: sigma-54 dependent transcriptional regulator [Thermoanaerobaculia bacterium]|nr:sigma-54 dependent transcriptional regulator [Thermoanaerobaculia bacterium]
MSPLGTVLVVDDEVYVRDSLASVLSRRDFAVRTAAGMAEALAADNLAGVDAVVTDLKLRGEDGLALVKALAAQDTPVPVIVLTGYGTVASAVECMQAGAYHYLLKPTDPVALALVLERALGEAKARRELDYLRSGGARREGRGPLGVSEGWRRVVELAEVAAPVDTSVLLLGESGTGKEEVAKLLHSRSRRAAAAFVPVNCAAIPPELFESEFFGHRRGAFTGAVADREGRFRVAHTGTLFLDEVDALPPPAQAKVLRVLQDGEFERVGDSRSTRVDVRLICATNVDLAAEVEAGRFRPDLYYRINVMPIRIPPLRERREDVEVLAEAFRAEFAARFAKEVRGIDPDALELMRRYAWPGNVRELRNVLERGVLLAAGMEITPADLPFSGEVAPLDEPPEGSEFDLRSSLFRAERRLLEAALERTGGVRREAARLLGVDERNMAYYLRKHDLMDRR